MTRRAAGAPSAARLAVAAALALAPAMVAEARQASGEPQVVVEIRVHGNHATPDADVLLIAGVTIGQPIEASTILEAETRLRKSGRFADVEIRKRFRSMESTADVVLVVVVQEHPVPDVGPLTPLWPLRRFAGRLQFLPVFNYVDGYGPTYGGRVTVARALGRDGRLSIPVTWGGTKRAALELDKGFASGPIDRLEGGASISRRENPYFHLDDDRAQVWLGVRRRLAGPVSAGGGAGYADVSFNGVNDRLATYRADVTLDTRTDPLFPRNAVFASVSWDGLDPRRSPYANRLRVDARGYRGLIGQSVLSLRWQYGVSSAALPPYEKFLVGGAGSLRGYRAGSFAGDKLMAATAEVRVPLSSPLGISRAGISVFADVAAACDHGARLVDTRFRPGGGAGVFLVASILNLSLDVGVREGGHVRVHFTTGLQF